ncbi:MAG: antibiotic acetyltransferase [Phycisphaerales bacterium]|nr:antibiotic acetyltransferase [Phycisphaerales bacterium]
MACRRIRHGLKHVHPTFYMGAGCIVMPDLVAGAYSFMNNNCMLQARVVLGRYVLLAPYVAVVGGDHRPGLPGVPSIFSGRPAILETVIEDDAWIGHAVTIMQGVRIGRGAIVAAGAVVTKDVPPYEIYGGIPAKKISDRFPDPADRARHDAMLNGPLVHGSLAKPQLDA